MTPLQILELISNEERLNFSQAFDINAPIGGTGLGNTLFPNIKTQNAEAEYFRLADGANVPKVANVHAFDTEAYIGSRDDFERVVMEPFFIKEKINQGENLRRALRRAGNNVPDVARFIFDDYANMSRTVAARADIMKHELLATGQITVNENNLNMTVDYGVPADHKVAFTWSGAANTFSPWQDIRTAARLARSAGGEVNTMIMSQAAYDVLMAHPDTQAAIYGTNGVGILVTDEQMQGVAQRFAGISRIIVDEERYRRQIATVTDGQPKYETLRKFKEDSIVLCYTNANGAVGTGLWGVTPEEETYQAFDNYSETGPFVTVTSWYAQDPVAVWTKASCLAIPVLPGIENSVIIATVALPANP